MTTETRRGNTGIWTFLMRSNSGHVFARSEWGRNHLFNEREWQALPLSNRPSEAELKALYAGPIGEQLCGDINFAALNRRPDEAV